MLILYYWDIKLNIGYRSFLGLSECLISRTYLGYFSCRAWVLFGFLLRYLLNHPHLSLLRDFDQLVALLLKVLALPSLPFLPLLLVDGRLNGLDDFKSTSDPSLKIYLRAGP